MKDLTGGRGSVKVYTERDELTFVSTGPLCPSPSFSALAPYSLNSPHNPSRAILYLVGCHVVNTFIKDNE